MVQLDESNIEIQWECPPCEKIRNPSPSESRSPSPDEPPQQTVSKPPPKPKVTQSSLSVIPVPPPTTNTSSTTSLSNTMTVPPKPVYNSTNGISKSGSMTANGNTSNPGRLSFPDVKIRDLPFYPVKATLLRPCAITAKDSQVCAMSGINDGLLSTAYLTGYPAAEPGLLPHPGPGQHSQQWQEGGDQWHGGLQDAHPTQVHQDVSGPGSG